MNTITIGEEITPIAILGQYKKNNIFYPAAQVLNHEHKVAFDPIFVASSLISLYEAFLSNVPDSEQIEFEKQFKFYLMNMFKDKEQYIIKIRDNSKTN
jgi:hypothetical protein